MLRFSFTPRTLARVMLKELEDAGLRVNEADTLPHTFPSGSASLKLELDCGGRCRKNLGNYEVIRFSLPLVVDASVRQWGTTNRWLGSREEFHPYWIPEAVVVGRYASLPPGEWVPGSAVMAASFLPQLREQVPYIKGSHNGAHDYFSSMAMWYGGQVHLQAGNENDRHGRLFIPREYRFVAGMSLMLREE